MLCLRSPSLYGLLVTTFRLNISFVDLESEKLTRCPQGRLVFLKLVVLRVFHHSAKSFSSQCYTIEIGLYCFCVGAQYSQINRSNVDW